MGNNELDFRVWVNDQELSFDPEEDQKRIIIETSRLQFKVKLLRGKYDLSQISVMVGADESLPGFEVRLWENTEEQILVSREEATYQLAGQRLLGRCAVDVCYYGKPVFGYTSVVWFVPSPEVQEKVLFMREMFEQANSTILDIFGLARETFSFTQDVRGIVEGTRLEKFLLLNHFYLGAMPFFRLRAEQLDSVLVRTGTDAMISVGKAYPLTVEKLHEAYRKGERLRNIQGVPSLGSSPVGWLPARVPSQAPALNFDTVPNRAALLVLKEMLSETEEVEELIKLELSRLEEQKVYFGGLALFLDYKKERLQYALGRCLRIAAEIQERIHLLQHLGVKPGRLRDNPKLWQSFAYRALFKAYNIYRHQKLVLPHVVLTGGEGYSLQTRSINSLYEIWVTYLILKLLVERLGFTKVETMEGTGKFPENYILKSGETVELRSPRGERVLFHYDRQYPPLENVFCTEQVGYVPRRIPGEMHWIHKNNPDISIEFYSSFESEPRIVVFDATFSNNPKIHLNKTYYQDTIWYRETLDSPKEEWIPPVVAAVAVHPFPAEDGLPSYTEFPLVPEPGAEDAAYKWLSRFFRRYGFF